MTQRQIRTTHAARAKLVAQFSGHSRLLAFMFLSLEAAFGTVIFALPTEQRFWAFVIFAAILAAALFFTLRMMQHAEGAGRVVLDAARTMEFLRMYQRSLANAQSRVVDETLAELQRNPQAYQRELFVERFWKESQTCREEALHFYNPTLGSLHDYFGRNFTKADLEVLVVNRGEPLLLDAQVDPIDRRRSLFKIIEVMQADLRDQATQELNGKAVRRKSKSAA